MSDVYTILETLEKEGLSGPLPMDGTLTLDSQALDKYVDDSSDPRWNEMLQRFFVESEDANHDDMLFFVRHIDDYDESNDGEQDPVFVLRKQAPPNILPPISEIIMWKETFLLNLIVQMPCKLTVAVCRRRSRQGGASQRGSGGLSMVRKHVSKRVYALPNKSRMDRPKDSTSPPECSWPHIYYVIDDYEDMFEDMFVKKGEYLCVELSARIPVPNLPESVVATKSLLDSNEKPVSMATNPDGTNSAFNSVRSRMTSSASTSGTSKIVLFQGAASFGALIDTYVQRLSSRNMLHRLRKPTYPTEFIMMRGPGGKGHAQVAIAGRPSTDDIDAASRIHSAVNSPVMSPKNQVANTLLSAGANNGVNSSRIPGLSSPPLAPHAIPGSAVNSTPSSPSLSAWFKKISLPSIAENLSQAASPPPPPKALQASMTFVSIPWQSIIEDLIGFKRQID